MEVIKFRGKRLYDQAETTKHYAEDKGVWKYGTYTYAHKYRSGEHGHLINDIYGRPIMCDEKTIGQFTGLKDKNKVEIYTGDCMGTKHNVVEFMNGCFVVAGDRLLCTMNKHLEVIGNIHDEVN